MRLFFSCVFFTCLSFSAGCSRFDAFNLISPTFTANRTGNLAYGSLPRQKLDIWIPYNVKPNARVVVFFYGGEWMAGEKWNYRFVAKALAGCGIIAVIPDYRVYPEVKFPKFVDDGALAVKWVHDHIAEYGGDPEHVFLMGHSAGAHIVALINLDPHYMKDVGLDRSVIRGTIGLSGPYDFQPFPNDLALFNMTPGGPINPLIEPVNFADGAGPPMLLIHGKLDDVCEVKNATSLAAAIHEHGGKVDTIIYPDRAHAGVCMAFAWTCRYLAPTLDDVVKYVETH